MARAPLAYDPTTDRHGGRKLLRGDVLEDDSGALWAIDRVSGFALELDGVDAAGAWTRRRKVGRMDPSMRNGAYAFTPLYHTGRNLYAANPEQSVVEGPHGVWVVTKTSARGWRVDGPDGARTFRGRVEAFRHAQEASGYDPVKEFGMLGNPPAGAVCRCRHPLPPCPLADVYTLTGIAYPDDGKWPKGKGMYMRPEHTWPKPLYAREVAKVCPEYHDRATEAIYQEIQRKTPGAKVWWHVAKENPGLMVVTGLGNPPGETVPTNVELLLPDDATPLTRAHVRYKLEAGKAGLFGVAFYGWRAKKGERAKLDRLWKRLLREEGVTGSPAKSRAWYNPGSAVSENETALLVKGSRADAKLLAARYRVPATWHGSDDGLTWGTSRSAPDIDERVGRWFVDFGGGKPPFAAGTLLLYQWPRRAANPMVPGPVARGDWRHNQESFEAFVSKVAKEAFRGAALSILESQRYYVWLRPGPGQSAVDVAPDSPGPGWEILTSEPIPTHRTLQQLRYWLHEMLRKAPVYTLAETAPSKPRRKPWVEVGDIVEASGVPSVVREITKSGMVTVESLSGGQWRSMTKKEARDSKRTTNPRAPKGKRKGAVGDRCDVHGMPGIIREIHDFGTIDVETKDGRWWRLTGLDFRTLEAPTRKTKNTRKAYRGNPDTTNAEAAWSRFHQQGEFRGHRMNLGSIPGAPKVAFALGRLVAISIEGEEQPVSGSAAFVVGDPDTMSLWIASKSGIDASKVSGMRVNALVYDPPGSSGKDPAHYKHDFKSPLPTLSPVGDSRRCNAVLLDGGRYVVDDWIYD